MKNFGMDRTVTFREVNALGVAHHSAFVLYCEETRVSWLRESGFTHIHYPQTDDVLALLKYRIKLLGFAKLDDALRVELQIRRQGLKIHFQYAITKGLERIAEAETLHIPVDGNLRPMRPPQELLNHLEKEPWTETWLSNS